MEIAERDGFVIDTDHSRLDVAMICDFVAASYWGEGVDLEDIANSIAKSRAFGLYAPDGRQAGFGRVVTDGSRFAYLSDVFVLGAHRGRGLGKWLVDVVMRHDGLGNIRLWMLATRDAHDLYRPFGFADVEPGRIMGRWRGPTDLDPN
jgi:GNAT superfamily N-acetyltransferase